MLETRSQSSAEPGVSLGSQWPPERDFCPNDTNISRTWGQIQLLMRQSPRRAYPCQAITSTGASSGQWIFYLHALSVVSGGGAYSVQIQGFKIVYCSMSARR